MKKIILTLCLLLTTQTLFANTCTDLYKMATSRQKYIAKTLADYDKAFVKDIAKLETLVAKAGKENKRAVSRAMDKLNSSVFAFTFHAKYWDGYLGAIVSYVKGNPHYCNKETNSVNRMVSMYNSTKQPVMSELVKMYNNTLRSYNLATKAIKAN